jgi:hypothetical protein
MILTIVIGAFVIGVIVSYLVGYLMLKPMHAMEARIHHDGRSPSEEEVGWGILNIRAEITMVRGGLIILNGLVAALLAVQLT